MRVHHLSPHLLRDVYDEFKGSQRESTGLNGSQQEFKGSSKGVQKEFKGGQRGSKGVQLSSRNSPVGSVSGCPSDDPRFETPRGHLRIDKSGISNRHLREKADSKTVIQRESKGVQKEFKGRPKILQRDSKRVQKESKGGKEIHLWQ